MKNISVERIVFALIFVFVFANFVMLIFMANSNTAAQTVQVEEKTVVVETVTAASESAEIVEEPAPEVEEVVEVEVDEE